MSKKYKLYVNNDNLYGCQGTYKVMDGRGNTLVNETVLTLDSNVRTKIGEQTVADDDIAYWGGTRFTFTSIGAPTTVSGEIVRNDYTYIKTLIILGATSVDVGSTANLYAYDETDDPEHNTPLIGVSWSSTGTYATVNSSTGVVTGISDGAETITATKPGYTQGTHNIRVNGVSEMLSPSITNVSTTTNEIDQSLTETILSFRVENINGFDVDCVSSAVVGDGDFSMGSSSGTCNGDYWLDISLSVPGDYSGETGLITVTFSKPGYDNAVSTKDFTVTNNALKGSADNPLTANDLNNNYIYYEYFDSFCVKNVNSSDVVYNLPIDESGLTHPYDANVYVKSGFDFILKFKTLPTSDSTNTLYSISTDIATTSPAISSDTELNPGQLYTYTIHGLSKGLGFDFHCEDDDGVYIGNLHIYIV